MYGAVTVSQHKCLVQEVSVVLSFHCSKLALETPELCVRSPVKVNTKNTRTTSMTPFWCLYCHYCTDVVVSDVIVWAKYKAMFDIYQRS